MGCNKWGNDFYLENLSAMNGFNPEQQRLGVDVTRGPGEHLYKVTVGPTTMLMLPDDALNLCEKLLYFFKAPEAVPYPKNVDQIIRMAQALTKEYYIEFSEALRVIEMAKGKE